VIATTRRSNASPYGTHSTDQPDCDQDDATQPAVFFDDPSLELFAHKGGHDASATGRSNLLFMDAHTATFSRFEPSKMTWHASRFSDWLGAL